MTCILCSQSTQNVQRFNAQSGQVLISHLFASTYSQPQQSKHLSLMAACGR